MRQAWILFLLAAMFSMHGISSLPRDAGMPEGRVAHEPAMALAADGMALDAAIMAAVVDEPMDGSATTDHDEPGHGMPTHLWSFCLAVLMAGAALVGLVLIARASPAERMLSEVGCIRRPAGLVPILRPPDLSALCLLRI
ncbi:DUF6153 family protein [Trujillonella humicola]|uniref:DUF6153 family protein n=1 Tax=Trujillonella humicola TaxID=3383699 RepID=UPI003905BB14